MASMPAAASGRTEAHTAVEGTLAAMAAHGNIRALAAFGNRCGWTAQFHIAGLWIRRKTCLTHPSPCSARGLVRPCAVHSMRYYPENCRTGRDPRCNGRGGRRALRRARGWLARCLCRNTRLNRSNKEGYNGDRRKGHPHILIINAAPGKRQYRRVCEQAGRRGARSLGATVVEYDIAGQKYLQQEESCRAYHARTAIAYWTSTCTISRTNGSARGGIIYAVPCFIWACLPPHRTLSHALGAIVFSQNKGKVPAPAQGRAALSCRQHTIWRAGIGIGVSQFHLMLMNCLPVTSDMPGSVYRNGAKVRDDGTRAAGRGVRKFLPVGVRGTRVPRS